MADDCWREKFGLADFGDFPRTNARGARVNSLARALDEGMHAPQVGIPTAPRHIVCMTDVISIFGTFSAQVAGTSHCHTPFKSKAEALKSSILPDRCDFAHREKAAGLQ
jgi:hypothetical protein